ncbi:MAG: hypothetical protein K0Q59_1787 [Paenibacillus sp.]|jgi:SPP1 gp7 family putative phage head morphogenesis protein|nr:hypothetical protein [Paenibacillus sp.]
MKTAEYWAKRMEALNEAQLAKGEQYAEATSVEYDKALVRIKRDTEAWYARLAKNNEVSLAEARRLLSANELKEFRWTVQDYIKAGRENAVDQRWMKQLENASAKVHISKLEAIQTQIQQEVELLAAKRQKGATDTLGGINKDNYYKSVYELQKGTGVGTSFAKLDQAQIDKVLSKPWTPDGRNFSSRIWADRTKLIAELQTTLTQSLINGSASDKVIADFADRMGVSKSNAKRLILTEAAYFAGQSRADAYRETNVERYKYIATLDSRTSTPCRHMDGKVFLLSEAEPGVNYPPLHGHCRSTTIPYFEDTAPGERAARDEDGETYYVPSDMTYKEWAAKHAPSDATKPPDADPPKPIEAPKVTQTPQGMAEDVPTRMKASEKELDELYTKLSAAEPAVTSAVSEAVRGSGGEMAGLEFRIKAKDSFIRKVSTDFAADLKFNPNLQPIDVAKSINDVLRYTAVVEDGKYVALYNSTILALINEGHTLKKVKNTWNDANNPYNGINVILVSDSGVTYELQFHTPESFEMKQHKLHELYEEYRLPSISKERKMELWKQMIELAEGIRKPRGVDQIK